MFERIRFEFPLYYSKLLNDTVHILKVVICLQWKTISSRDRYGAMTFPLKINQSRKSHSPKKFRRHFIKGFTVRSFSRRTYTGAICPKYHLFHPGKRQDKISIKLLGKNNSVTWSDPDPWSTRAAGRTSAHKTSFGPDGFLCYGPTAICCKYIFVESTHGRRRKFSMGGKKNLSRRGTT